MNSKSILFPYLNEDPSLGAPTQKKIAIVTGSLEGLTYNSGIGTAYAGLAELLNKEGHSVTIIYANAFSKDDDNFDQWQKKFLLKGIRLLSLHEPNVKIQNLYPAQISYITYLMLKKMDFDIVHFPDQYGIGFYSLAAKQQGLAFLKTTFCVMLHGPQSWHYQYNKISKLMINELQTEFFEKQSIEWADVCIAPSQYILSWAYKKKWKLPAKTFVESPPLPTSLKKSLELNQKKIDEIIFFGRLETRKGIEVFCDAIDLLPKKTLQKIKITFLGSEGFINGLSSKAFLKKRTAKWKHRFDILNDMNRKNALRQINIRNALVVIPSIAESFGFTFIECLNLGAPFIASSIPVFEELLQQKCHKKIFFKLTPKHLRNKILQTLDSDFIKPELNRSLTFSERTWRKWHNNHVVSPLSTPKKTSQKLYIFISNKDSRHIKKCMASIKNQTYEKFEIVTRKKMLSLSPNDFILFINGNTFVKPRFIETLMNVAYKTKADIVTCGYDYSRQRLRMIPSGDDLNQSYFINPFGEFNFLIKKQVLNKNKNQGFKFFLQAKSEGFSIATCPEVLFQIDDRLFKQNEINKEFSHTPFLKRRKIINPKRVKLNLKELTQKPLDSMTLK